MISKEAIEDLEVALPSLKKQEKIVELATLIAREKTCFNGFPISGNNTFQQY